MSSMTGGISSRRVAILRPQLNQNFTFEVIRVIKGVWRDVQDRMESQSYKKISETIPGFYSTIRDVLVDVMSIADDTYKRLSEIERQIKDFIETEREQGGKDQLQEKVSTLDDCMLWIILWKAVDNVPDDDNIDEFEREANMRIIRLVIDITPWLAFDNPTICLQENTEAWEPYRTIGRCTRRTHVHKSKQWDTTPFHRAAANNNYEAIDYMLKRGMEKLELVEPDKSRRQLFTEVLQKQDWRYETALGCSTKAGYGRIKALKVLLDFYRQNLDPNDKTFPDALNKGRADVVEAFLDAEPRAFVNLGNISKSISILANFKSTDVEYERRNSIVILLVSHVTTAEDLDENILRRIIQLNLKDILKEVMENADFNLECFGPLHLAVEEQSVDFVEIFLRYYPHLVTSKHGERYPLWYNNYEAEDERRSVRGSNEDNNRIRDMILTATIKSKEVKRMEDLLNIFQKSGKAVSALIRSLVSHQDDCNLLSYERTIRYVEFPALDLGVEDKETFGEQVQCEHFEVFHALNWL
ncbi:hypothetical protein ACHAPE_004561 [Trichoderma viride]